MLKEVMFQGRIDKYLYTAIKRINVLPLQRRQKSIELQILIINKSLFDFTVETVTGSATFQVVNEYTLPTINCVKHLKVPRNSEAIYEINIENIAEENADLILECVKREAILWHFALDLQINIPASFKKDGIISYSLDYKAIPRSFILDNIGNSND